MTKIVKEGRGEVERGVEGEESTVRFLGEINMDKSKI